MERKYYTKTGVELSVIDGGGQGDGIPRGNLTLVKSENRDLRPDDVRLIDKFDNAFIMVQTQSFLGGGDQLKLQVIVTVDQKEFQKTGTSKKRREKYLGGLSVDLKNYIYRFYGVPGGIPTVDHSKRARRGVKTITFYFDLDESTAKSLGVDMSEVWPSKMIKYSSEPTPLNKGA